MTKPVEALRQIASARGMGHLQMIERARAALPQAQEQEKLIGELAEALRAADTLIQMVTDQASDMATAVLFNESHKKNVVLISRAEGKSE